jgi:flagellar export protein FliJ
MAKLRFQTLVELYASHEDEARRKVGVLERDRADACWSRDALVAERAAAAISDPRFRDIYARFCIRIGLQIDGFTVRISQLDQQILAARTQLIECHRQHETFKKLRERDSKHQSYLRERRQARMIDDMNSRRRENAS